MDYQVINNNQVIISKQDLIDLLEYKRMSLEAAKEEDSSWNYDIDGVTQQIAELKA